MPEHRVHEDSQGRELIIDCDEGGLWVCLLALARVQELCSQESMA